MGVDFSGPSSKRKAQREYRGLCVNDPGRCRNADGDRQVIGAKEQDKGSQKQKTAPFVEMTQPRPLRRLAMEKKACSTGQIGKRQGKNSQTRTGHTEQESMHCAGGSSPVCL
jgi:hypothetical protein